MYNYLQKTSEKTFVSSAYVPFGSTAFLQQICISEIIFKTLFACFLNLFNVIKFTSLELRFEGAKLFAKNTKQSTGTCTLIFFQKKWNLTLKNPPNNERTKEEEQIDVLQTLVLYNRSQTLYTHGVLKNNGDTFFNLGNFEASNKRHYPVI